MTDTQATLISGIIGAVLGGAIGVIGTYIGAVHLSKKQNRSLAALKLREAFVPTLAQLRNVDSNSRPVEEILETDFIKHQAAIDHYRFFIDDNLLAGGDKNTQDADIKTAQRLARNL